MTNQEKQLKELLGGYIEIKPSYSDNFEILKSKELVYIGNWSEIEGFIAGVRYTIKYTDKLSR